MIKVGVIGAGAIVNEHCGNLSSYKGAELVAIADKSMKRAEAAQKKWGIARSYSSWEALVRDKEIDAVAVALPNALHAKVMLAAMEAGKHVLIDKPFTVTYEEAKACVAMSRRKKRVLMVGMNQRYGERVQGLRALVDRGELGDVFHVKANALRRSGSPKFGTWFVNKKLAGGGCLLDIGVHVLDQAMYTSGCWDPVSVSGKVYSKFGHRGLGEGDWGKSDRNPKLKFDVEDSAMALIKCASGATIDLTVSWTLHQERSGNWDVQLFGTEGGATMDSGKRFRWGKRKGEYEVVETQNVRIPDKRENRHHDWLDQIAGKRMAMCTLEQALIVQRVLDAIYKSSETGREQRLR